MYFEIVSASPDCTSVNLTLKMLLMTVLLRRFHAHHHHLILGHLPLLGRFLVAFNSSMGTPNGYVHDLVLVEEELVVKFVERGHTSHNRLPLACDFGGVSRLRKFP